MSPFLQRVHSVTGYQNFWKSVKRGWRSWERSIVESSTGALQIFDILSKKCYIFYSCFFCHLCSQRFHSFLLFLGYSRAMVKDTKAEDFCRTISNFSLEYRSTRQAILLQREREKQKSGVESPGPNTPVGRTKRLQIPSQVHVTNALKLNLFFYTKLWWKLLLTFDWFTSQECEEQCKLEEVLRTPESVSRLDLTLPRTRRKMVDIKGTQISFVLIFSLICTDTFVGTLTGHWNNA